MNSPESILDPCITATLSYENKASAERIGAVKISYIGHTTPAILCADNNAVCAKLAYYMEPVVDHNGVSHNRHKVHEKVKQMQIMSMELKCAVWAECLLSMCYVYIQEVYKKGKSLPPFPIPELRFVRTALALAEKGPDIEPLVFLLEELISDEEHGHFEKYVNNSSAEPEQDSSELLLFLYFTQHCQYWLTGKMAYVSDYQGIF
jgi:hypothetical protein